MTMALLQRPWWNHMWGAADAWGWMMVFMMLFWVVILAVAVWLIVRFARSQGWTEGPRGPGGPARAEDIVRERYARGEIDRETYVRMLEDLRRGGDG